MKTWKINDRAIRGELGRMGKFAGPGSGLSAVEITVLESSDGKSDAAAIRRLASPHARSIEIWWDGGIKQLRIIACAHDDDMEAYASEISSAYGGIQTSPLESHTPEWFNDKLPLHYWDWSWENGHYALALDKNSADVLSELATRIQKTKQAWVQVVFRRWSESDMFGGHVTQLEREDNRLTREKERLELENKRNGRHTVMPDDCDAFQGHSNDLIEGARQKRDSPCAMMSIRCVCDTGRLYFGNSKDGSDAAYMPKLSQARQGRDQLVPYLYGPGTAQKNTEFGDTRKKWSHLFRARSLPGEDDLKPCTNKYCSPNFWGNYPRRISPPFLVPAVDELPLLLKMPSPKTANLNTTNNPALPKPKTSARGFNIGFTKPTRLPTDEYHGIFGRLVDSNEAGCVVLPPELLQTHVYVPGATGHGKTTLIMGLMKHLEIQNIRADMRQDVQVGHLQDNPEYKRYLGGLDRSKTLGEQGPMLKTAFIYVDPKGDDSAKFIRMCEPYSLERKRVHYLDPVKTEFSINPLELPQDIGAEEREAAKSRYVGYFIELIKEWFGDPKTFVRLHRIFQVVMHYLYDHTDCPTLADVHGIVQRLQQEGKECLTELYNDVGESREALQNALHSIAGLEKSAFDPVLTRLEQFVLDEFLKNMFCSARSTVSLDELIRAGSCTIVRLAQSDMAPNAADRAIQALVMKLWFAIQERSGRTRPEDQTQVVLVLDEFQVVKDIGVLERMLEQARSKKLCLVLTHQALSQLDGKMQNNILTNCGFQMTGRLVGGDAARLADAWDRVYSEQLERKIPKLPKYCWIAKGIAAGGTEQSPPVEFWTHFDTASNEVMRDNMTDAGWNDFVREAREKNIARRDTRGLLGSKKERRNKWLAQVEHGRFFSKDEWPIMVMATEKPRTLKEITGLFQGVTRDEVRQMCGRMVLDGLLRRVDSTGREADDSRRYSITQEAKSKYMTFDPGKIGNAGDVAALTEEVVAWYLERGYYVAMAKQNLRSDKDRADLVAYNYETGEAISVEIESESELNSHWEQAEKNMTKWPEMGFDRCQAWSYSYKIIDVGKGVARKAVEAKNHGKKDAEERLHVAGRVTVNQLVRGRTYRSSFIHGEGAPRVMVGQDPLQDAHFKYSGEEVAQDSGGGEPPSGGDPDSPSSDES